MNLELIVSPSGFGKTNYILEDIDKSRKESKIIIVTPDQNSYNFEKQLCEKFGGTFNIDVVNFSRLCKKIESILGIQSPLLDETSKYFYYLELVKRLKDKNNFLIDRLIQDFEFVHVIDEIITELNDYNITENELEKYCQVSSAINNHKKIKAIKEIQEEYSKIILENKKLQKREYLKGLLHYIDCIDFSDYIFYIDGYYNFSPLEYELISKLILKSKKLSISLISDIDRYTNFKLEKYVKNNILENLKYVYISKEEVKESKKYSLDIYRKSHEVIAYINDIILKNSIKKFNLVSFYSSSLEENYLIKAKVEENDIYTISKSLYKNIRYENEILYHIQKEFPKNTKSLKVFDTNKVTILEADNIELEVQQLCRNISREISEYSYKASDIAILYRDENYENFRHIFKNYNLNIHLDKDINVTNHRLIKLIKNLINYSDKSFKIDILNILKTNLCNFEEKYKKLLLENNSIEKEENLKILSIEDVEYILEEKMVSEYLDIEKEYFLQESKKYTSCELNRVKILLQEVVSYIKKLQKKKNALQYVKDISNILDYFDIKMLLNREDTSHESVEELENISIDRQVYDKFLKLLNEIEENFSSEKLTFKEFSEVLIILLNKIKYRAIPQVDDYIIMSKIDLSKVENKKVVFVIGFNKDVLPKISRSNSILDDSDKKILSMYGIDLSPNSKSLIIDEDFVAYISLTRAKEKLYISYSKVDKSYKKLKSSIYIESLSRIFNIEKGDSVEFPISPIESILSFDINDLDRYDFMLNKDIIFYSKSEIIYIYDKLKYSLNEIDIESRSRLMFLEKIYSELINSLEFSDGSNNNKDTKELDDRNIDLIDFDYRYKKNIDTVKVEFADLLPKRYSYTQLNNYISNEYIYFIDKILSIKKEEEYGITSLNKGEFVHAIMEDKQILNYIKEKSDAYMCEVDFSNEEATVELMKYINSSHYEIELLLKNILKTSRDKKICNFLTIIKNETLNFYTLTNIVNSLIEAIKVEIQYAIVTNYRIIKTEEDFLFMFDRNSVSLLSKDNKVIEKITLEREYDINKFYFSGKIDRVDFNGDKYIIIDYKSSQSDFKLDAFLAGEPSQLLIYMLAIYMNNSLDLEKISGVFFRELAKPNKDIKNYRLRGLMNLDFLKELDSISNIAYVRVKNAKDKLNRQPYATDEAKVYSSFDFKKIMLKNVYSVYTLVEKIQNYEYNLENKKLETKSVFDYAASIDTRIKRTYTKVKSADFKKNIDEFLNS